jgi:hypothetical protein
VLAGPVGVLAHAFGERYESPVPTTLFVLGGAVVVLLSFMLVYQRQVTPAPDAGPDAAPDAADRRLPAGPGGTSGRVLPAVSVLLLAGLVSAGLLGDQELSRNLLPVTFWLVVWVVLPLVAGLAGDLTPWLNPFAALARWADSPGLRRVLLGSEQPLRWPDRLGWWPAVVLFYLVVAGELIFNQQATLPRVTAAALIVYALLSLVAGLVVGAPAWCGRGELFSVLFSTWGRLGVFRFGRPGRRGIAGGLDLPFAATPSRVVFVLLLLVSVTFDGVLSTPQWTAFLDAVAGTDRSPEATELLAAAALLVITLVLLGVFGLFALAAERAGGRRPGRLEALTVLLPSLLPIAYGYQLAHYAQYIAINGQLLIPLASDPAGRGWQLLPSPFDADYTVDLSVMPASVTWYVQLVAIVFAHVVAVVLAHRHLAWRARSEQDARRSEWPWLAAMVGYTMVSLWLLAQPLVEAA